MSDLLQDFITGGLFDQTFDSHLKQAIDSQSNSVVSAASGCYVYRCDNQLMAICEPWQKVNFADSIEIISGERRATDFQSHMWVQSEAVAGLIKNFKVHWQQMVDDELVISDAEYQIAPDRVKVTRLINGKLIEGEQVLIEETLIVSPLMRIYVGDTILKILTSGGQGHVLMPWIKNSAEQDRLLELQITDRRVTELDQEQIEVDDDKLDLRCFRYTGDQYDDSAKFCVDKRSLLRYYKWRQNDKQWDVRLQDFKLEEGQ